MTRQKAWRRKLLCWTSTKKCNSNFLRFLTVFSQHLQQLVQFLFFCFETNDLTWQMSKARQKTTFFYFWVGKAFCFCVPSINCLARDIFLCECMSSITKRVLMLIRFESISPIQIFKFEATQRGHYFQSFFFFITKFSALVFHLRTQDLTCSDFNQAAHTQLG